MGRSRDGKVGIQQDRQGLCFSREATQSPHDGRSDEAPGSGVAVKVQSREADGVEGAQVVEIEA